VREEFYQDHNIQEKRNFQGYNDYLRKLFYSFYCQFIVQSLSSALFLCLKKGHKVTMKMYIFTPVLLTGGATQEAGLRVPGSFASLQANGPSLTFQITTSTTQITIYMPLLIELIWKQDTT
jgi:hypothetical protein